MPIKTKTAFGMNFTVAIVSSLVGISYLISSNMTSYHMQVIGVDWNTLAPGAQTLLLILKKGTGDACVLAGLAIAILLFVPFRRRESWSRWAILAIGYVFYIPMLGGALYLASTTGASSPWWLNAIMLLLLTIGFFITGDFEN